MRLVTVKACETGITGTANNDSGVKMADRDNGLVHAGVHIVGYMVIWDKRILVVENILIFHSCETVTGHV